MLIFLIPLAGMLLWIAYFVVVSALLGIIWGVLGLLVCFENVWHRIVGRKKAANSKPKEPLVASRPNAPRGPSEPKPPLEPAGSSTRNTPPAPEPAAPDQPAAEQPAAGASSTSDIWPKWTPSRRRDVDRELAHWQEQFNALNSPK